MAKSKMLILRGNSAPKGSYPDEKGDMIAWPDGALHVGAARAYAASKGYDPLVLDVPGQPQSQSSPQAKAAIKAFLEDETVAAFYGFSGGGYNLRHILQYLAENKPETLRRIELVVVLGSPLRKKREYTADVFNAIAKAKVSGWKDVSWDVVYRTNPKPSQMPQGLPKDLDTHMFGPDVLLAGWLE